MTHGQVSRHRCYDEMIFMIDINVTQNFSVPGSPCMDRYVYLLNIYSTPAEIETDLVPIETKLLFNLASQFLIRRQLSAGNCIRGVEPKGKALRHSVNKTDLLHKIILLFYTCIRSYFAH